LARNGRSPVIFRERYGRPEPILTTGGEAVLAGEY
jgi:hypothetical protein